MFNPDQKSSSLESHTPLELLHLAEFMASKYELASETKGEKIQYNEDQKEKFLKIVRVLGLFVDDHRVKDAGGLIPALEKATKMSENVSEKHEEKNEIFDEENIEDRYLALEFVKNNMKNPSLGKDFEEWLKTHK